MRFLADYTAVTTPKYIVLGVVILLLVSILIIDQKVYYSLIK